MPVLVVTDDVDDDIRKESIYYSTEVFYKQLKQLEYDSSSSSSSSSSSTSISILESSPSIIVKSNQYYRQHRRRHHCRLQPCLVQHLLTYMITLLLLTNHCHWSVIALSFSSIKFMSANALTTTTTATTTMATTRSASNLNQNHSKRPISSPSIGTIPIPNGREDQCLPLQGAEIERICSRTCRARQTPFEKFDNISRIFSDMRYLPFCSHHHLHQAIGRDNFFDESTENECRQFLEKIVASDEQAREASELFGTYMKAIDSASDENRYSIITSNCQQAYRVWTCSVSIPFYYRNQKILPCQTICDEVERVCPTFRPSDREPLFAGQPLFFCNGGVVANSDYGQRPRCFDACHLAGGSLQRHSVSSSPNSSKSFQSLSTLTALAEEHVTTPQCFEIELPNVSLSNISASSSVLLNVNDSIYLNMSNGSLAASARTISFSSSSLSCSLMILILIYLLR